MDKQEGAARYAATVSSAAGIYDYLLNGTNYSGADEIAAEKAIALVPETRFAALENRAFMHRAVRYIARRGVRQYIDIGSGFPAAGPVHEVAGEIVEDPRVVYVDYDPVVAARSREMVNSPLSATIVHDLRRPEEILEDPEVLRLIDWSEPVALLMVAILHFITDRENPGKMVAAFRDRMAPGSYLVASHVSAGGNPEGADDAAEIWDRSRSSVTLRSPAEFRSLFAGFDLVPPGVVSATAWGTDRSAPAGQVQVLAAVGEVPPA
jgi:hypothetical protein